MAFAREVAKSNEEAWEVVDEQTAVIACLEAEVAKLWAHLAEYQLTKLELADGHLAGDKPTDSKLNPGRRRTFEDTRVAILADLTAGLCQREAATRNGVSAMTVSRLVRGV